MRRRSQKTVVLLFIASIIAIATITSVKDNDAQHTGFVLAFVRNSETSHGFQRRVLLRSNKAPTRNTFLRSVATDPSDASNINDGLKIAVVGSGPSGLLLSHYLLNDKQKSHKITLFDGRSDPRTNKLEGRAYALGIGIRGRSAIRSVDESLWQAVKSRGFESERFNVHIGVSEQRDVVIPLRSESKESKDSPSYVEPSLLLYQSELCASLLTKLEEDHGSAAGNDPLDFNFETKVVDCNLDTMMITASSTNGDDDSTSACETFGPFDLIVGCDGVNSRVRESVSKAFPEFHYTRDKIPGLTKVVRLGYTVGKPNDKNGKDAYDPKAVCILLPSGAFIEPVGEDGSCCILFSGRSASETDTSSLPVYLTETQNVTAVTEALRERFPRWKEEALPDIAKQLMGQGLGSNSAYSVTCNTYHYQNKVALIGDAAHATGGVSGQGVNSALVDAMVLGESLTRDSSTNLETSLLEYSMKQVPEGKALYDLSFGPKPKGFRKKLSWGFKNIRDALFQGRLGIGEQTLQTRLSSELTPFAEIRRERDYYYKTSDDDDDSKQEFPSDDDFRRQIESLHESAMKIGASENTVAL